MYGLPAYSDLWCAKVHFTEVVKHEVAMIVMITTAGMVRRMMTIVLITMLVMLAAIWMHLLYTDAAKPSPCPTSSRSSLGFCCKQTILVIII